VEQAKNSVVSIVATKNVAVLERYFVNPFGDDPFFQQFFGDVPQIPQYRQKGTEKQQVGAGTGFLVSADGMILTNKHVVADTDAEYTVFLNDSTKISAKVLARDLVYDFAILKIEKSGLPPLRLGDSDALKVGQTVIAIGNALGEFSNTVSVGIVSGLGRSITASGGGVSEVLRELIQTDAAINPGNSGGPLLNLRGEVIGVNVAMAQGAENIGFAIAINKAKRAIESVQKSGKIIYPFLGVRYVPVTRALQEEKKLAVDYGALVIGGQDGLPAQQQAGPAIVKGSPAEKAGLKEGDIILEIGGARVDAEHSLASLVQERQVGETVSLKILRDGKDMIVPVILEERK
jgi:serine protease Do